MVVAGVAIIPFGGWSTVASKDEAPRIALGQQNDGLPWNVTVTGARLLDDQPPLHASVAGNRWVVVLATVEVTSDESRYDIADALRISGVEGLVEPISIGLSPGIAPATVLVVSDLTDLGYLHPGLPENVAFAWEQSSTVPVPTQLQVTIFGKTVRRDTITGFKSWLDPTARGVVTVPVVDRRGA